MGKGIAFPSLWKQALYSENHIKRSQNHWSCERTSKGLESSCRQGKMRSCPHWCNFSPLLGKITCGQSEKFWNGSSECCAKLLPIPCWLLDIVTLSSLNFSSFPVTIFEELPRLTPLNHLMGVVWFQCCSRACLVLFICGTRKHICILFQIMFLILLWASVPQNKSCLVPTFYASIQNHRMVELKGPSEIIWPNTLPQAGPCTAGCPGLYWGSFWVSLRMETLQLP